MLPTTALAGSCADGLFQDSLEEQNFYDWPVTVQVTLLGNNDPGRAITLVLNASDTLNITADGAFCFNDTTQGGQNYNVWITQQPTQGDVCDLGNGAGIATGPVSVAVTCNLTPSLWDQMNWDADDWN